MTPIPKSLLRWHTALTLLTGLAVAQVIGFFFVRQSNRAVVRTARAAISAGWLAIPSGPAAEALSTFQYAFWGALFFTLSTGTLLTLSTWAATWVLNHTDPIWRRRVTPALTVGWAGLLVYVNFSGVNWFATLLVLCVPLGTLGVAVTGAPFSPQKPITSYRLTPLAVLLVLAGLWATQNGGELFTTIRDRLLLSNPIGHRVNDFYYRYTLSPAELLKSPRQRTMYTCSLENFDDRAQRERLVARLATRDLLTVDNSDSVDIRMVRQDKMVRLHMDDNQSLEADLAQFMKTPDQWLQRLFDLADRHAPLRHLTFPGVLIAFPVLLYMGVYGLVRRLFAMFLGETASTRVTSLICLVLGIMLIVPLWSAHPQDVDSMALNETLASTQWQHRVAALKQIERQKLDIARYPNYRALLRSPRVVERYWLARALAVGRDEGGYCDLLRLITDPHPNVVCQVYYALGHRGRPEAIAQILTQMRRSDHWYTQWYGYRAMKELGWRQSRSN